MEYIGKHQAFHNDGPGSLLTDGGEKILVPHKCYVGELVSDRHYHMYVKYAYTRALLEKRDDLYYWKGIYSKMQLEKNREPDFEKFDALIMNIRDFGFNHNFPIPVDINYDILDGSHRLAVALALNIMPTVQIYSKMSKKYEKDRFKNFNTSDLSNIDFVRTEIWDKYKSDASNEIFITVWGMGLPIWNDILDFLGKENIKRAFLRSYSDDDYAAFIKTMYSTDAIRHQTLLRKSWALTKFENAAGIILLDRPHEEIRNIKNAIRDKFINKVKEYHYDSILHTLDNVADTKLFIDKLGLYKPIGDMPSRMDVRNNLNYMILNGSKSHEEYKNVINGISSSKTLLDLIDGRFDLVIFDLDGTIVNSEITSVYGYMKILSEFDIDIKIEDALKFFCGHSKVSNENFIEQQWGIKFSDKQIKDKKSWIRQQKENMTIVEGITEFISKIKCTKVIASGSSLETIDKSLRKFGFESDFPVKNRFSASQVKRGKPEPDLFILASRKFGINPDRCIVIEDSPDGIKAAIDAGMHFIWFGHGEHIQYAYNNDDLKFMTQSHSKRRQTAALKNDLKTDIFINLK